MESHGRGRRTGNAVKIADPLRFARDSARVYTSCGFRRLYSAYCGVKPGVPAGTAVACGASKMSILNRRGFVPALPPGQTPVPTVWTRQYLAARLKISVDTLDRWILRGMIPSPYRTPTGYAWWSEQLATEIMTGGAQPEGTYPVAPSPRRLALLAAIDLRRKMGFVADPRQTPPPPPQPDPTVGPPPAVTVRPATKAERRKYGKRGRASK
jgi:hypothetical protein